MKISRFFLLTALLVGVWSRKSVQAQGPGGGEVEARLTGVKGEVTVFTAEEPDGVSGDKDLPLVAGDRVKTSADASAELTLSGEHGISLRADSEFTITSLKRGGCVLTLARGSLLANVRTLAVGDFRVATPAAVAAVRGAEFGVEVDPEHPDQTHVGVFDEGRVTVSGQPGQSELLKANQETSVRRGGRPMVAYQLRRFVRQRQFMRTVFRNRVQDVRKNWHALDIQQRAARRREMLPGLRQLHQQRLQKLQQVKQRGRPSAAAVRHQRADQLKMEKFKQSIRDRQRQTGN